VDAKQRVEQFGKSSEGDFATFKKLLTELHDSELLGPIASLLIAAARRALYQDWELANRKELAEILRDHQQFGYARRLFGCLSEEDDKSDQLRQQHALCTYKDVELPAARRLERALEILGGEAEIEASTTAETLGIAGAIYKRKWEVEAKRADLESSLRCYELGYGMAGDPEREYTGINAAYVCDQLAALEKVGIGVSDEAQRLRDRADEIRQEIVKVEGGSGDWTEATLAEAYFGLGRFEEAGKELEEVRKRTGEVWRLESTAMQLASLARLRQVAEGDLTRVLQALLGEPAGAIVRGHSGKVGLALSGGGFRASLFHIGVLARLAECDVLRRVEVLSCVSGGSILGAYYYLKLRRLLERKADAGITGEDYVTLVHELADEFMAAVRKDLRGKLLADLGDDLKMLTPGYSRTDRVSGLLDELFYSEVKKDGTPPATGSWRMTDLYVKPHGRGDGFSLRYENWLRVAKVPILVLNATSLNTGHNWQFTASWMGEPPTGAGEKVDASRRLRRVYYGDAPEGHGEPSLATAVAASACVPGLFPPVTLTGLYDGIDVELADGGVHDNQGVASLLEQDCTVVLVSDASGQASDVKHPKRRLLGVAKRANSVLMGRVREAQYSELADRKRSGVLRGLMVVHLKKGLQALPRDWIDCQEPYRPEDDGLAAPADPTGKPASDQSPYGIDPDVQWAMAELRTDLDAFSDDEAYTLMAAGYAMATRELPEALPDLVCEELSGAQSSEVEQVAWLFADALGRLSKPNDLADSLRPGHARFLRSAVAWRMRQKRKGGLLGKLVGREGWGLKWYSPDDGSQ
jgi:predicted acylesterase/phospholipase RssA